MLSIIVAMDKNHLIGKQNTLPWHLPADLAYFKKTTSNKTIVMGRKTYESIGRPLPNRRNIVLSSNQDLSIKGVEVAHNIQEVVELVQDEAEVFIIGGANIYAQTLAYCKRLYITQIDGEFEGDAHFPSLDLTKWQMVQSEKHLADENNLQDYCFSVFEPVNTTKTFN